MAKIERVIQRKSVKTYRRNLDIPNARVNEFRKIVKNVTRRQTTVAMVYNPFVKKDVLAIRLVPPIHLKTEEDLARDNAYTQKIQEGFNGLPKETKKYLKSIWVITSE